MWGFSPLADLPFGGGPELGYPGPLPIIYLGAGNTQFFSEVPMIAPGLYSLGDFAVTASAIHIGEPITGLGGAIAISLSARLSYGSGGSSIRAFFQTSLDQGTTWQDVACILFGTASEHQEANISGLTPKTTLLTPSDGALADDTVIDGILGDMFRCKVISTGTYAASTVLSTRIVAR